MGCGRDMFGIRSPPPCVAQDAKVRADWEAKRRADADKRKGWEADQVGTLEAEQKRLMEERRKRLEAEQAYVHCSPDMWFGRDHGVKAVLPSRW